MLTDMANDYRKWRILLARALKARYFDCEDRKRTQEWIHTHYGVYLTGVNDETFANYCNKYPDVTGEIPLAVEAFVDLCEKFFRTATELESGLRRPSEIDDPECQPVVRAYLRRRAEKMAKEAEKKKR